MLLTGQDFLKDWDAQQRPHEQDDDGRRDGVDIPVGRHWHEILDKDENDRLEAVGTQ